VGGGPLFEKRVLVTRAAHQAEDFAAQLAARGALPVIAPAIEIGPPDDARDALGAIRELHVYAWVAFTSRNGVDAFFEGFASPAAGAAALACVKVAAIGSKTAQRLSHFGIARISFPRSSSAKRSHARSSSARRPAIAC